VRCRGQGAVSDSQLCRSIVERGYGQNAIIMIINVNFEAWSRGASESLNEGGCRHQELVDTFSISDPLFKRSLSTSFMFHCLGCCEKHLHLTMASCLISLAPLYIYCSLFILHDHESALDIAQTLPLDLNLVSLSSLCCFNSNRRPTFMISHLAL